MAEPDQDGIRRSGDGENAGSAPPAAQARDHYLQALEHFGKQAAFDRNVFEKSFKALAWTTGACAVVVTLAAGCFTYWGVNTYHSVEQAAGSMVDKAIMDMRPKVEIRIQEEFKEAKIAALIKRQAEKEISSTVNTLVAAEVEKAIRQQHKAISKAIADEVRRQASGIASAEASRHVSRAVAPRSLTEDQKAVLIRELARGEGQKLQVFYTGDNWEAHQYAEQLAKVFDLAGWKWTFNGLSADESYRDVFVLAPRRPDGSMPESYLNVLQAFRRAGLASAVREGSSAKDLFFFSKDPDAVTIIVGQKVAY